jgi:riboflavin biosynthesis pyrimidine reductase
MANMVMSVDGAFAVSGHSGGLAGPADKLVFHTLRASADVVLVAAGTARQERYRRPSTRAELLPLRRAAGLADAPRLVVVSRSVTVPADQPFLTGVGAEPLLLHPERADTSDVPPGVELRPAGNGDGVDLGLALAGIHADGVEQVMCEGGPHLLGQLHREDLLDELFLTLSPLLAGGDRLGLLGGIAQSPRDLHLHRALEEDGFLFLTYRRTR